MSHMKCIIVTPEKTVVDCQASFVAVPLYDGELGIAPHHTPLVGRLGAGELRITIGEEEGAPADHYYVEGGFVEVAKNVVSILTSRAIPAEKLVLSDAEQRLKEDLHRRGDTPELQAIRERAVNQSRAMVRVAQRAAQ